MEFLNICGIAAICCSSILVFAGRERELSVLISCVLYCIIMLYALSQIEELLSTFRTYQSGLDLPKHFSLLLKCGGVAIVGAIASAICENAGQTSAAKAIDLLTVLETLFIALPIFKELMEKVSSFFGG